MVEQRKRLHIPDLEPKVAGCVVRMPRVLKYLALGGSHLSEQGLGDFGPLHLLLNLIVDGGVDVEDTALCLSVPLAWQRRRFHLQKKTYCKPK